MELQETASRREPLPGNQQLSEEYKRFKTLGGFEPPLIHRWAEVIRNCPIDIREYFAEHRSLENLRGVRIGKGIKTDLLIILDSGIDKALECKQRANDAGPINAPEPGADLRNFQLGLERERRRLTE